MKGDFTNIYTIKRVAIFRLYALNDARLLEFVTFLAQKCSRDTLNSSNGVSLMMQGFRPSTGYGGEGRITHSAAKQRSGIIVQKSAWDCVDIAW